MSEANLDARLVDAEAAMLFIAAEFPFVVLVVQGVELVVSLILFGGLLSSFIFLALAVLVGSVGVETIWLVGLMVLLRTIFLLLLFLMCFSLRFLLLISLLVVLVTRLVSLVCLVLWDIWDVVSSWEISSKSLSGHLLG